MPTHLLGVRHHGPGSSRHVLEALDTIKPDLILIEGPPEGEAVLSWAGHEGMQPPVALLAYVPDNPQQAVFYPFTTFSPEWNALQYAHRHQIPVRFIDMPLVHSLAVAEPREAAMQPTAEEVPDTAASVETRYRNPIAYLAEIAGFDDAEEWWEYQFELQRQPPAVFDAIGLSMSALRRHAAPPPAQREAIREAFMRRAIRKAEKEMYADIAVICGAWHVPALSDMPPAKEDDALLKNLAKTKVEATWIPWTNDRLSLESGYGAGLESPGWYEHTWQHPDDDGSVWLSRTARVFREHRVDVSAAHIIEAVRLANALAGLRLRSRPGLKELNEATLSVMCMGDPVFLQLVHRELIIGRTMGAVPEGTPQVPLQRDLDQAARRLRLKISHESRPLKLDLREESDLQRSQLLHRLRALGAGWGRLQQRNGKGTFKEEWTLCWYPELTIQLLEKAPWGNTVATAAGNYLAQEAQQATRLDTLTGLLETAVPAGLGDAVQLMMKRMDALAAGTSDTLVLMNAFLPLVRVSRYGDVRGTDQAMIATILHTIFYRITAGLPMGCTGIDDAQAAEIAERMEQVHQAVQLLETDALRDNWQATLEAIRHLDTAAPLVRGYACKALYDSRMLDSEATAAAFALALSANNEPAFSAAWLEGFLKDAAHVLILDDGIWHIVDSWLQSLPETVFLQVIPLLRRTFSTYGSVEKNKIAARAVQAAQPTPVAARNQAGPDEERAATVLPVLRMLMGL